MTRWSAYDSHTNRLDGFDARLLPDAATRFIRVFSQNDPSGALATVLEVGPYVGVLPLRDGSNLYLVPRVGPEALSRMFAVSERLDESVRKEFEEFADLGFSSDGEANWIQTLTRSFADRLRFIEKNSLRMSRRWQRTSSAVIRGRFDPLRTSLNLAQGKNLPVASAVKVRTAENPENRFLSAAARSILSLGIAVDRDKTTFRWWAGMSEGPAFSSFESDRVNRDIISGRYAGSRSYYIPALVMARLILYQGGVSFDSPERVRGEALLTNVYSVFETYLRVILRRSFTEQGYIVDKAETGNPTLFVDGTAQLKPDIVISNRGKVSLVLDAKYKLGETISNADYYQMKSYLDAFNVDCGVIIRPADTTSHTARTLHSGKTVHEIGMNLQDWANSEQELVAFVGKILQK